ncbi:hypothetical protein FHS29_007190 [Saccharothrix tamanrassetensis]|uniref:Peptidase inhibitor family I36 n=1 Tax=Saccharothrix tamanrassetensis TaxID=1051531 RepID=A0A841CQ77_9PSEU|nr:peptidase inhibitor family I36 protein [Saccharothrix tamanrassetensis]MBB5960562.1 hypothetical protein [Saccharothrix tamanrassetensis]
MSTTLRLALVAPVLALSAVLAPVALAQATPAVPGAAEPVPPQPAITRCDAPNVCVWTRSQGLGTGWQTTKTGCINTPWPAFSVSNQSNKTVRFYEGQNCNPRTNNFVLNPKTYSDYAGGLKTGVKSFFVPK